MQYHVLPARGAKVNRANRPVWEPSPIKLTPVWGTSPIKNCVPWPWRKWLASQAGSNEDPKAHALTGILGISCSGLCTMGLDRTCVEPPTAWKIQRNKPRSLPHTGTTISHFAERRRGVWAVGQNLANTNEGNKRADQRWRDLRQRAVSGSGCGGDLDHGVRRFLIRPSRLRSPRLVSTPARDHRALDHSLWKHVTLFSSSATSAPESWNRALFGRAHRRNAWRLGTASPASRPPWAFPHIVRDGEPGRSRWLRHRVHDTSAAQAALSPARQPSLPSPG